MLSLMQKLKNLSNLDNINCEEIEFLLRKNSTQKFADMDNMKHQCGKHKSENYINGNTAICSACRTGEHIISDNIDGSIVCSKCGNVIEYSVFDRTPEWKTFDDSTTNGRCGAPINNLLPSTSMGTYIGGKNNHKLKMLQNWCSVPSHERSLSIVFNMIKKICENNGLDRCVEDDAKILYKKASEYRNENHVYKNDRVSLIIRRKNRIGLISACVYYACKRYNCAKSVKEISKIFGIEPKCVNKGCKNFIKYTKHLKEDYNTSISVPSQYVLRFCKKLGIEQKYVNEIITMTEKIQKMNTITSHTPLSIASACVFRCLLQHNITRITKNDISNVFGISEVTIIKTYNHLNKYNDILDNDIEITDTESETPTSIPKHLRKRLRIINAMDTNNFLEHYKFTINKYLDCNMMKYYACSLKEYTKYINDKQNT